MDACNGAVVADFHFDPFHWRTTDENLAEARRMQVAPDARLVGMQWLHWALLVLSAITILAAVAGSQGMSLVP